MNKINCLKGKLINDYEICKDDKIDLGNGNYIPFNLIPSIKFDNKSIYYLPLGAKLFLAEVTSEVKKVYAIEYETIKNSVEIKNLYTYTEVNKYSLLARYFRYDKEIELDNIKIDLMRLLNELPFIDENEINFMSNKINKYMNYEVQAEQVQNTIVDRIENVKSKLPKKGNKGGNTAPIYNFKGKEYQGLIEICHDLGINYSTLWNSLNRTKTMSLEEAVDRYLSTKTPFLPNRIVEFEGTNITLSELAELTDLPLKELFHKIVNQKVRPENAVAMLKENGNNE